MRCEVPPEDGEFDDGDRLEMIIEFNIWVEVVVGVPMVDDPPGDESA